MPTNRKRKRRQRKAEITPEERQWLTGEAVPGQMRSGASSILIGRR